MNRTSGGGFRASVLTLLTGSTVAMGLSFLLQPVMTRMYSPEAFGVANYFVTLVALLGTIGTFRYDDALMIPDTDEEAGSTFWLAILLLLAVSLLCLFVLPWRTAVANALGIPALSPWLLLLPPALLASRGSRVAEAWFARRRQFLTVSIGNSGSTILMTGSRIAAGAIRPGIGTAGLVGGYTGAYMVGALYYVVLLLKTSAGLLRRSFRFSVIKQSARKYRAFSLYSTPSAVLNNLLSRLPLLIIPAYFGDAVLGLVAHGINVMSIPLSLVGGAIAQVFFVHAAESRRAGTLSGVAGRVHGRLVQIGLFPTIVVMLAGPDLFEVIFGPPWRAGGTYLGYLAPWLFLASVASPLTRLFDVLGQQKLDLLSSVGMTLVLAAALVAGGLSGDVTRMLAIAGIVGAMSRAGHIVLMLRLAHVPPRDVLSAYRAEILRVLVPVLIVALAQTRSRPWLTLAGVVTGAAVYALISWRAEQRAASED